MIKVKKKWSQIYYRLEQVHKEANIKYIYVY